jgi:hypothetical protein
MKNDRENPQANNDYQKQLISLAENIKTWWEDHKYDTCGEYGDCNVYNDEPKFVTLAKNVLGNWEL